MESITFTPHKHGGQCDICETAFGPYEGYYVYVEGALSGSVCDNEHPL